MPKTLHTVSQHENFGLHKMPLLKNGFLEKIETWHVGLSCQCTHFLSFSSKSEHDSIADQATLMSYTIGQIDGLILFSYSRIELIYDCLGCEYKVATVTLVLRTVVLPPITNCFLSVLGRNVCLPVHMYVQTTG